jgi:hypothetical protein
MEGKPFCEQTVNGCPQQNSRIVAPFLQRQHSSEHFVDLRCALPQFIRHSFHECESVFPSFDLRESDALDFGHDRIVNMCEFVEDGVVFEGEENADELSQTRIAFVDFFFPPEESR